MLLCVDVNEMNKEVLKETAYLEVLDICCWLSQFRAVTRSNTKTNNTQQVYIVW